MQPAPLDLRTNVMPVRSTNASEESVRDLLEFARSGALAAIETESLPLTCLLDKSRWAELRHDYCALVERPRSARGRLERLGDELDTELAGFAEMLEAGGGPARLDGDRLVVPRDVGDGLLASVAELKAWVKELIPPVELAEVVIQIDAECGFSQHLLHAAGARSPTPAMLMHLYEAILAQATNLGPEAMARASGLSYEQIAHATAWYLREETLTPTTDTVVNHHHRLPISRLWGDGTFSSSDGQRFPVQVQAANAVALPRYFGLGRGITAYTWVSDHYATYANKVVETNLRDATFVLDGIFGLQDRDSELDIAEHTTDTAGYTELVFAVFDLVGLKFSPRIRDLADQQLWHLDDTAIPALVEPWMRQRINTERIAEHWDDMLRVGASIQQGHVASSLLIAKLQAHPRKNQLTRALQEYGRLVKTLLILRYLQDPAYRKRVGRQLNKGESVNALRDTVLYAHHGNIRHRQLADQAAQAACLSLVVNCVAAWNATYLAAAVERLRAGGFVVADDDISHLGPTMCEHINVHGRYHFTLDQPPKSLRPLTALMQKTAR